MRTLLTTLALIFFGLQAQAVEIGDDGLHKTDWMRETFNDMAEDLAEAQADGRTLLVLIEQRGCIYCKKMHEEVFVDPEIDQFIRDNYFVVQLNMFGDIEVTDFDGTTLPEKEMVRRWGQSFTPTMMFFAGEPGEGQTAPDTAVTVVAGAFGTPETMSLLMWAHDPTLRDGQSLSDFHAARVGG